MRLVLYQPDIPQNTGTLLRLAACLGLAVDIIEPCGFIFDDRRLKRAGMDYLDQLDLVRHASWPAYQAQRRNRLVLLTTRADLPYTDCAFVPGDALMVGQESAGVPPEVAAACDMQVRIPLQPGLRSLNVAIAAAMVVGEALRQTQGFAP